MFRHVVLFRFVDGITVDEIAGLTSALEALPARIPAIKEYTVGPDLGVAAANRFDYAIVATFDDESGWRKYMDDTEHDRIRADVLGPIVRERATSQFEY